MALKHKQKEFLKYLEIVMILVGIDFTAMDTVKHKDNKFKLQYWYWECILLLWLEHKEARFITLSHNSRNGLGLDVAWSCTLWTPSVAPSVSSQWRDPHAPSQKPGRHFDSPLLHPCTSSVTSPADSASPGISHISCHLSTPVQASLALTSLQPLSCCRSLLLQSNLRPHCRNNDYCVLCTENVPRTVLSTLCQCLFDHHNFPMLEGYHFFINEEPEFRG